MKTQIELNTLKKELEALNEQLRELTDEELKQVIGGRRPWRRRDPADGKPKEYGARQSVNCPYCGMFFGYKETYDPIEYEQHVARCQLFDEGRR